MKVSVSYTNNKVVMQPTSSCNLNCSYCYLPGRKIRKVMSNEVCKKVAEYIIGQDTNFEIIWHGGEPLTCGVNVLESLFEEFKNVKCHHSIQTNATLITQEWCEFFKRHDVNVGLSIDGDAAMNAKRISWNGKESFDATLNGIMILKENSIPFSIISVVGSLQLDEPVNLYNFILGLGCWSWGINIEETEGANIRSIENLDEKVNNFWSLLFHAWYNNPQIRIREFDFALSWMDRISQQPDFEKVEREIELFPSISCSGNMVLLSPEFVDLELLGHDFSVGNILKNSMSDLLQSINKYNFVSDFSEGIRQCAKDCEYFSFCGGGYASNKYFENGSLNSTVTQHCRNTKMSLINNVIKSI